MESINLVPATGWTACWWFQSFHIHWPMAPSDETTNSIKRWKLGLLCRLGGKKGHDKTGHGCFLFLFGYIKHLSKTRHSWDFLVMGKNTKNNIPLFWGIPLDVVNFGVHSVPLRFPWESPAGRKGSGRAVPHLRQKRESGLIGNGGWNMGKEYMDVSIPKSSILIGFVHCKPSILGHPLFWKHPIIPARLWEKRIDFLQYKPTKRAFFMGWDGV